MPSNNAPNTEQDSNGNHPHEAMLRDGCTCYSICIQHCRLWSRSHPPHFLGRPHNLYVLIVKAAGEACWHADLQIEIDYAYIMYVFRMQYAGVHNIADAAGLMGGPIAREVAGGIFLLTWM